MSDTFHRKPEVRPEGKAGGVCLTVREWLLGDTHSVRQKVKFLLTKRNEHLCEPRECIFTSKTSNSIWMSHSRPIGQARTTRIVWKDYPSRRCRQPRPGRPQPPVAYAHTHRNSQSVCHDDGSLGTFSLKMIFFLMWTILKSLLNLLNLLRYCFCYYVLGFLDQEACGILAPQPGIKPSPSALEDEVSTTGSPGKSWYFFFIFQYFRTTAVTIMALMEENKLEIKKKKCVPCRTE